MIQQIEKTTNAWAQTVCSLLELHERRTKGKKLTSFRRRRDREETERWLQQRW
jgi:hypothetical protein